MRITILLFLSAVPFMGEFLFMKIFATILLVYYYILFPVKKSRYSIPIKEIAVCSFHFQSTSLISTH